MKLCCAALLRIDIISLVCVDRRRSHFCIVRADTYRRCSGLFRIHSLPLAPLALSVSASHRCAEHLTFNYNSRRRINETALQLCEP
eukprot:SAG11_NODE_1964_length_3990_cov_2.228733_2_plen_86_part_00